MRRTRPNRTWLSLLAAGMLAALLADPAAAQQAECGGTYTVGRGDTLSRIAQRVYGDRDKYLLLHEVNRAVIGPNPALLEVGMVLTVPCLDEKGAVIEPGDLPVPLPPPQAPPGAIVLAAAANWAPFSAADAPEGGIFPVLMRDALGAAGAEGGVHVTFAEDWRADPRPLLADTAYDFAFPAARPDCEATELPEETRALCDRIDWSDPVLETLMSVYTAADAPAATEPRALAGQKVCRAAGIPDFVLAAGIPVDDLDLVTAPTASACLDQVVAGEAAAAVLSADVAGLLVARRGGAVVRQPGLDWPVTLHVATSRDNLRGAEYLEIVNTALATMKADGRWFEALRDQSFRYEVAVAAR